MSKRARFVNSIAIDVVETDTLPSWAADEAAFIEKLYPDTHAAFVAVPDEATAGSKDNGDDTYEPKPVKPVPSSLIPAGQLVAELAAVTQTDFFDNLLLPDEQDALLSASAKAESKASPTPAQLATRRLMFHFTMVDTIDLTSPKLEKLILAIKPLLVGDWRSSQITAGQEPTASDPKLARGGRARAKTKSAIKRKPVVKAKAKTKAKTKTAAKAVPKARVKAKVKSKAKVKPKAKRKTKSKR